MLVVKKKMRGWLQWAGKTARLEAQTLSWLLVHLSSPRISSKSLRSKISAEGRGKEKKEREEKVPGKKLGRKRC